MGEGGSERGVLSDPPGDLPNPGNSFRLAVGPRSVARCECAAQAWIRSHSKIRERSRESILNGAHVTLLPRIEIRRVREAQSLFRFSVT
jgi:hypothetical protein